MIEAYQRNPQLVAQVRAPLYEEKVVDYIMELVKVTNHDVSREVLFTEDDPPVPQVEAKPKKTKKAKAEKAED